MAYFWLTSARCTEVLCQGAMPGGTIQTVGRVLTISGTDIVPGIRVEVQDQLSGDPARREL